jgi:hypothetical protein
MFITLCPQLPAECAKGASGLGLTQAQNVHHDQDHAPMSEQARYVYRGMAMELAGGYCCVDLEQEHFRVVLGSRKSGLVAMRIIE